VIGWRSRWIFDLGDRHAVPGASIILAPSRKGSYNSGGGASRLSSPQTKGFSLEQHVRKNIKNEGRSGYVYENKGPRE
jgi:hypothetical protein